MPRNVDTLSCIRLAIQSACGATNTRLSASPLERYLLFINGFDHSLSHYLGVRFGKLNDESSTIV